MMSLIGFFPIDPTYTLSNIFKQLWLGYPGGSYDLREARLVVSFQHILAPGFGDDLASVLTNFTKA